MIPFFEFHSHLAFNELDWCGENYQALDTKSVHVLWSLLFVDDIISIHWLPTKEVLAAKYAFQSLEGVL